jgi:hypothetical protein
MTATRRAACGATLPEADCARLEGPQVCVADSGERSRCVHGEWERADDGPPACRCGAAADALPGWIVDVLPSWAIEWHAELGALGVLVAAAGLAYLLAPAPPLTKLQRQIDTILADE